MQGVFLCGKKVMKIYAFSHHNIKFSLHLHYKRALGAASLWRRLFDF